MDLCIVEQQPYAPAGLLAEWAAARGHRVVLLRAPDRGADGWPDPAGLGAIAALGAEHSVHASPDPWIPAQIEFLARAHERDVPVLGLCFGAQALAAALGGEVRRAPEPEIGWLELQPTHSAPVPPGPWFTWHYDTFTVPPGARELARSAACPQGFALGRSVGLQFHPEVTPQIIDEWLRTGRDTLDARRVDAEAIRARAHAGAGAQRRRAFALFDAIAAGWTNVRRPKVQR